MASLEKCREGGNSDTEEEQQHQQSTAPPPGIETPVSDGLPQTGPKGVLTDYFRKMEEDKQREVLGEKKRKELILQHSATVTTHSEDAAEAAAVVNVAKALEEGSLDQDPFLQQFRAKRMEELKKQQATAGGKRKRFGNLVEVRGDKYDVLIDNCPPGVLLIIHIYNEMFPDCMYMNKSLTRLAKLYPTAKFCRVQTSQLGVSQDFIDNALPSLMIYCNGEVRGNFVRITNELGSSYEDEDLEQFLQSRHCIPPESDKEELFGGMMSGAQKILGAGKVEESSDDSD